MTSRRDVLALLAGAACPGLALAQPAPQLGVLMAGSRGSAQAWIQAYRIAVAGLGTKVAVELSFADGKPERLPQLAADLAKRGVQVIVAVDEPSFNAARAAAGDRPVLVGSIATPVDVAPREVEVLAALRPKLSRLAVLVNPANSSHRAFFDAIGAVAARRRWRALGVEVEYAVDLESAFDDMRKNRVGAVVLAEDGLFSQDAVHIAALGRERRMATVGQQPSYANAGCLFSCGEDPEPRFRSLATEVDRLLKGGKPAEPAAFRPARVPIVLNRGTARAIGVAIPPGIEKSASFVEGG
jgi:putative tryptophan/tyrosine transport system substrate-binding protein